MNLAFAWYQDLSRPRLKLSSADNFDLGLDKSWYHVQPHPIIVKYIRSSVSPNDLDEGRTGEVVTVLGLKNGRITNMAITGVYKGSLHK